MSRFAILFIGLVSVLQLLACNVYDSDLVTSSPLQKDHGNTDETPPDLDSGSYADQDSNDLPTLPINDARAHDDAKDANSNDASDAGDESDASDAGDENDASDAGDESDASDESDAAAVDSGAEDGGVDAGADTQVPTDNCPEDPDKTEPGVCGCGIPDTDTGGIASCTGLISAIVHRYRFDGTGTTIVDSAGSADGTTNAALAGDGKLTLAGGGSSDYATLPSGILSALSATTVEFWLTWQGSSQLQRTISFGTAVPATVSGNYCSSTSAEYHNGSWYQFCIANMGPWPTVRSSCEGAGGHLAAIESAEEEQYIENHSSFVKSVWIGANDVTTEGEWYFATADGLQAGTHFWSGGKNGSAVGGAYENWGSNEPANSDSAADCAFLYHAQPPTWRSLACSGYQGNFLCEWRGHQGSSMSRGVWFTPRNASDFPSLTFKAGNSAVVAQAANAFPAAVETHVALVLEPGSNSVSLYIEGELAASAASNDALANLRDADNWLGRSHVSSDASLSGSLSELRIYNSALTAEQLATSHLAGPDPEFLEP